MKKNALNQFRHFRLPLERTKKILGGLDDDEGGGPCVCLLGDTKVDCGNNGGSINCRTASGNTYTLNCQAPAKCE